METRENWRQTRHSCEGSISFITSRYYPRHSLVSDLRVALLNFSEAHPWRDATRGEEWKEPSVLGPDIAFDHKWGAHTVKFRLSIQAIKPAQLYAFHGYMDSLAKALAELRIKNVSSVQGAVSFHLNGGVYDPDGFLRLGFPEA
ncbi:MAG TPA: hypothetical protein VGB97_02135 [Candidatus Paceibacterota bacterium]|jgi:hypothetical protein